MKKILFILTFILFFLSACSSLTVELIDQQKIVRNTIMECQTFDCDVIDKEKQTLQKLINEDNINQAFQQSIVTTITFKCMDETLVQKECKEYNKEIQKLQKMY
jgi:hypothetical protein